MLGGLLRGAAELLAKRPLCFAACLFGLGVYAGGSLGSGGGGLLLALAIGLALTGLAVSRAVPGFATLAILLSFCLAGAHTACRRGALDGAPEPEAEELLEGWVGAQPSVADGRTRFVFQAVRAHRAGTWHRVHFRLHSTLPGTDALLPGDFLRMRARFRPVEPPLNPGAPNLPARARAEGIAGHASVLERQFAVIGEPAWWRRCVADFRRDYGQLVEAAIPHPESSALVRALAVGERSALAEDANEDFVESGLAHVLSVSGLHIAVVAAGLFRLLRWLLSRSEWLLLRVDARTLASLATIPATWLYVALTGAEVPAVRSGIMASALFLSHAFGRDEDGPSALAAALLAVLAWDPAAAKSISFLLSFSAVAGLMTLTHPLRKLVPMPPPSPSLVGWRRGLHRGLEYVLLAGLGSLAASLVTGPIAAAAFQRTSLVAVAANAIAMPVASLLTAISATSALVFALIPSAAAFLVTLAEPLARGLLWLSHAFASLPFASARVAAPSAAEVVAWYLALIGLPLLRVRRGLGRTLVLAGVAALIAMAAGSRLCRGFDDRLAVTFLAVGQGDATLLRLPGGRAVLVDGGGDPLGRWDVGARVVVPALVELGVHELEAVVLSHPHPDHARGLLSVLKELPVRELWVAQSAEPGELLEELVALARERGTRVRTLGSGDHLADFSPVQIEVLHPPTDLRLEGNDASLVIKVALGKVSFLLAGDVERHAERLLLESGGLDATVLKVPHHGSTTSSSEAFVRAVAPRHAVFSVGNRKPFNFPHAPVVARYRQAGCSLQRTDRHGAIQFRTDGTDLLVERFREPSLPLAARIATLFEGRHPGEPP